MMVTTIAQNRESLVKAAEFTAVVVAPVGFITIATRGDFTIFGLLYVMVFVSFVVAIVLLAGSLVMMSVEGRILRISMRDGATRRLTGEGITAEYGTRRNRGDDADAY